MARIAHVCLLALLLAGMTLPARPVFAQDAPQPVETAAVTDTPVVTEPIGSYVLAGGLLYWSYGCIVAPTLAAASDPQSASVPQAQPAAPVQPAAVTADPGYLRRLPVNGGFQATILTSGPEPDCYTFRNLTADGDGVYYYKETAGQTRIDSHPGGVSGPPLKIIDISAPFPLTGRRMATDATYAYWMTENNVWRARKDGTTTTPIMAASGLNSPNDILVVKGVLYILQQDGLSSIATDGANACPQPAGPCPPAQISSHGGYNLAYHFQPGTLGQGFDQFFWTSGEAIRRRSCSTLVVCFPDSDTEVYNHDPDDLKDWFIGRVAFNGNVMFFQEATPSDGFLRRKDLSVAAQDPRAADTIANPYPYATDVYVNSGFVYFRDFQFPNDYIMKLSVLAAPIVIDLKADKFEVTQGIQNAANQAPLIARKTTFVRAYGSNILGPRANSVQAYLYGTRNGSPLPGSPLKPTNGSLALFAGRTYDRSQLNDGWLFQLPSSWIMAGAVAFRLVVDPFHSYPDPSTANNTLSQSLTFQPEAPACAIYVPVRTHDPRTSTSFPNFRDMVGRFQRLWPVPNMLNFSTSWQAEEIQVCWYGPFPHPCGGPFELNEGASISDWIPDKDEALAQLWLFNVVNDAPACDNAGGYTHIMGMVHPSAATGNVAGYASTVSAESWVKLPPASPNPFPNTWNGMRQSAVMAQELAHNYGRKHVDCGSPGSVDNNYPYTPCQIANTGQDSYYGFDSKTLTPISPTQARDFMAYGNNFWVSDYTWKAIITKNAAAAGAESAQAASPNAGLIISANGTVLASGHLDTQKLLGQLNYVKVLPAGSMSASMTAKLATVAVADYSAEAAAAQAASPAHEGIPDATNFHLRLIGTNNAVLENKAVTLIEIDDHDPDASAQIFVASFAAPAGQVVRVELLADNTVLDTLSPGVHAPVVAVSQPTANLTIQDSLTVAWNATDADLDPLVFTLQYSYDGGTTWQALTGDLGSTPNPANQITLDDLSGLHGSAANAARVRVIASDGFNTTIATSQPFMLSNRKPVPVITDPSAGQIFDPQQAVGMHGNASDGEDGLLEDASLTWKLNHVVVATGIDANLVGLAPGDYTATLEAKDSASNVGTASAPLHVAPLSIPLAGSPLVDGFCDDAAYAAGAQVALHPCNDADHSQAIVHLVRDANRLYACLTGLKVGAEAPGAFAGLRFDVNNSREPQAQATDYGFFVGENGAFFTYAGNGAGGFAQAGPGGLQAQISADANGTTWNAELRIDKAVLGGWDHIVGMKAGHYSVGAQGDDYGWPYAAPAVALYNAPNTWARTALGLQPVIDAVTPLSMTVGSPAVVVTVEGQNFDPAAVLVWNGTPLATTTNAVVSAAAALAPEAQAALDQARQAAAAQSIDPASVDEAAGVQAISAATVMTAAVAAALLTAAGAGSLVVRNPGPLDSSAVTLAINNATPVITTLVPPATLAEGPTFSLTVNGSGFANGAKVIWNGMELPTTLVSANQVKAQVGANLLLVGMDVGVAVRNPAPVAADSNTAQFNVLPNLAGQIFLPTVQR